MARPRFRLSSLAQTVVYDDVIVLAHGPRLQRLLLRPDLGARLLAVLNQPFSREEFDAALGVGDRSVRLFSYLITKGFLVREDVDEVNLLHDTLLLDAGDAQLRRDGETYNTPAILSLDQLSQPASHDSPPVPLKVQLIGGCVLDFLKDELQLEGLRHGYIVESQLAYPDDPERVAKIVEQSGSDMVVVMLGTTSVLAPMWDDAAFVDANERRKRTGDIQARVAAFISVLDEHARGRLIVVHNFAPPQVPPFGRVDFRNEVNARDVIYQLNSWLDQYLRSRPNFLLVDEERLVTRHGAETLFDDHLYPTSHHGGMPDVEEEHANQLPRISQLLSHEYIALYRLWSGAGKIKCIVCDLDGTLWPGQAAEDGFTWSTSDDTSAWLYRGIHQALRIIRERGILLATCSKNDEEATLDQWRQAASGYLLSPDDFVMHKINWRPKSDNIREIATRLGIAHDAILFLDDDPVQRAEVTNALPRVRTIVPIPTELRRRLLTDPALEVLQHTEESARRSTMLKAQLMRDDAQRAATDIRSFLQTLDIRIAIEQLDAHATLTRVHELLQRTTQFNTTLIRPDEARLRELLTSSDGAIYVMRATDRLVNYGLVGVCICRADRIESFVMSCRVIGLSVALPFLATIVRRRWKTGTQIHARIVEGHRNHPCRTLFLEAGFERHIDGWFVLSNWQQLIAVDPDIHAVTWSDGRR